MAKQGSSGISWTDETWNPMTGCTKVSQGCHHCYAERVWSRLSAKGMPYEGRAFTDVQCHPERLEQPLRWRKPRRVFVNSVSDLFHEAVPFEFIDQVFAIMALAQQHTYQILTKRPECMRAYFRDHFTRHLVGLAAAEFSGKRHPGGHDCDPDVCNMEFPLPHVHLGISAEDQETADERIPLLLQTPAAVRFISLEPLLAPIDLERVLWPEKGGHRVDVLRGGYWNKAGTLALGPSAELGESKGGFTNHSDMPSTMDWIIVGGESGPKARPMHPVWVRNIRDQCQAAGVPFFFKQGSQANWPKFKDFDSFPEDLRIREYPNG